MIVVAWLTLMFLLLSAPARSTAFQRLLFPASSSKFSLLTTAAASTSTTTMSTTATATSSTEKTAYEQLVSKLETLTHLERCQSVLKYDQLVFMPEAASSARGQQLSALAGILHQQKTDPALKELLQQAVTEKHDDDKDAQRLLELETKAMEENERIPAELAAKAAALGASAYSAWVQAKNDNNGNFEKFAPVLQDCFDTAMELAKAKRGENTHISLYTQMLDEYEVGMEQQRIDDIFAQIQSALVPLIQKVVASPHQPNLEPLHGTDMDIAKQQEVGTNIVKQLGFDTNKGRIDVSVHPFTSSMSSSDVRITSRFRTDEWYQGLAAMMHEAGTYSSRKNEIWMPQHTNINRMLTITILFCHLHRSRHVRTKCWRRCLTD